MDEKMKEIEDWINFKCKTVSVGELREYISYLLSLLKKSQAEKKELEIQLQKWDEFIDPLSKAETKINELEEEVKRLQERGNKEYKNAENAWGLLNKSREVNENLEAEIKRLQRELEEQKALIPWIGELAQAKVEIKRLQGEMDIIDNLLARRDALDSEPTRYSKISKAIRVAKQSEKLEASLKRLREGIGEVLDGTLPYLAEQRLKKLVEVEEK